MPRPKNSRAIIIVTLTLIVGVLVVGNATTSLGIESFARSQVNYGDLPYSPHQDNLSNSKLVWFFGYVGNSFYPKTELNISVQSMVNTAKNLSEVFGKENLILLTSVDEIPGRGGTIGPDLIPKIASYVSELKEYANAVYGRLDFSQFNLTASIYGNCDPAPINCPIFNQTSLYINRLGLNGVWFDHALLLNQELGSVTFNELMQNLTDTFPNATFILNTTAIKYGTLTELPGFTWENDTYITPSANTELVPNYEALQEFYNAFPGRVLLHLDADGPSPLGAPKTAMAIFANLTKAEQISTLQQLIYDGSHPEYANETYNMICPIVGSWDYINSTLSGVLYNSLAKGRYAQSTLVSFEQVMLDSG